MQLSPTVLEDALVRLEPLGVAHRAGLRAACAADPTIWEALYPVSWDGAHFDPTWAWYAAENAAGRCISFAVLAQGQVVGTTSYLGADAANAVVEIGGTYYRPQARGGAVNPAAKRLLLGNAFARGARRVQFKVDALNARSRAAVTKLGAVAEGVLRQDRVVWTGRIRDTAVYSILAAEWPAVRARLDARLAALGAETADVG
jgi:RimJ/RimL family protein N-acetyltransferase